jgi:hypothetical protein
MTDEGKPLEPEQIFKRVAWRSVVSMATDMEKSTTWTVTGVAAIVALFISNLDSMPNIITTRGIRWSLILFASSLLGGAISKVLGMGIQSGLATLNQIEKVLTSEDGTKLMDAMKVEPRKLVSELAEPFVWPLSWIMKRSGEKGITDYLASDKRLVRMFCWQIYSNFLHTLLAVLAIGSLAVSINV